MEHEVHDNSDQNRSISWVEFANRMHVLAADMLQRCENLGIPPYQDALDTVSASAHDLFVVWRPRLKEKKMSWLEADFEAKFMDYATWEWLHKGTTNKLGGSGIRTFTWIETL